MSAHLSGWCSPSFGLPHTRRQHVACRSAVCGCEEFGGHEKPVVDRDSASYMGAIRGETCDNSTTTLTANKVVRATAAKRPPDPTITQLRT